MNLEPVSTATIARSDSPISDQELSAVRTALQGMLFGSILVVVQDGVIVQIDRTEKHRIRPAKAKRIVND